MAVKLYGTLVNGTVVLGGASDGVPIELVDAPTMTDGYTADYKWVQDGGAIKQVWHAVPPEGSEDAAKDELSRIIARTLDDKDALAVMALFPAWDYIGAYTKDERVTHAGKLWRCLEAHLAGTDKEPGKDAKLWAEVTG